jgi:hypothetical protein
MTQTEAKLAHCEMLYARDGEFRRLERTFIARIADSHQVVASVYSRRAPINTEAASGTTSASATTWAIFTDPPARCTLTPSRTMRNGSPITSARRHNIEATIAMPAAIMRKTALVGVML